MVNDEEMEEYEGMFIHQTDAAVLFVPEGQYDSNLNYDEDDAVWLPKSQIDFDDLDYEKYDPIIIRIPEWLAEEKGL